jgi:predicted transcriptional regulator
MSAKQSHLTRFVEQLGRLGEGEGLPRTAGRMMGLLMMSDGPMSIDALAEQLKVSRASISTNGRLLESLQIVERETRPGDRRDYLQISGEPCSSLLSVGIRRLKEMRKAVREMRLAAHDRAPSVRNRLQRMERFYELATTRAESVLAAWKKEQKL